MYGCLAHFAKADEEKLVVNHISFPCKDRDSVRRDVETETETETAAEGQRGRGAERPYAVPLS